MTFSPIFRRKKRVLDRKEESVYYSWTWLLCFNGETEQIREEGAAKMPDIIMFGHTIARILKEKGAGLLC